MNFADLLTLARNYNKALPAPGTTTGVTLVSVGPSAVPALSEVLAQASQTPVVPPAGAVPKPVTGVRHLPAKATAVLKPVTPIARKAAAASVLRDDDSAKPVFSTTRVDKATPAKPTGAAKEKAR